MMVQEALEDVGLAHTTAMMPAELSGGMQRGWRLRVPSSLSRRSFCMMNLLPVSIPLPEERSLILSHIRNKYGLLH